MRRFTMAGLSVVCVTGTFACGQGGPSEGDDDVALGSLELPLVASTESATYRLAAATFTIDGPTPASLSASDDPAETELSASLEPGNYQVLLEQGWELERDTGNGFVGVTATLLTANPRTFGIVADTLTSVTYRFETDGTVVGTGDGEFQIDIQVDDSTAPACTAFGEGCPAGTWCAVAFGGGCVPFGSVAPGASCLSSSDCVANSLCTQFICREYCSAEQVGSICPGTGNVCTGAGVPGLGACD